MMKTAALDLTKEWDKTFPRDERVDHCKVTFVNRYGITLAADMFVPKKLKESSRPLRCPVPSERSRNRSPADMRRKWQPEAF